MSRRHSHDRALTVRLPGGVRWRLTLRRSPGRWGQLAVHRTTPAGRRTLVATGTRRFDGTIAWTVQPDHRAPAAEVLLLLRATEGRR